MDSLRILASGSFKIFKENFHYVFTLKQLKEAIAHGGTEWCNRRGVVWSDNGEPAKSLPHNKYAATRVHIKNNFVLVYLPYTNKLYGRAQHLLLFDKTSLIKLDEKKGYSKQTPIAICKGKDIIISLMETLPKFPIPLPCYLKSEELMALEAV